MYISPIYGKIENFFFLYFLLISIVDLLKYIVQIRFSSMSGNTTEIWFKVNKSTILHHTVEEECVKEPFNKFVVMTFVMVWMHFIELTAIILFATHHNESK